MQRRLRLAAILTSFALGLAVLVATRAVHADDPPPLGVDDWSAGDGEPGLQALAGRYTGFGSGVAGGAGRPIVTVTTLADAGAGSLRVALAEATRIGGATIVFGVAGDVRLEAALEVPAHTTVDGLDAPTPGVTLWGDLVDPAGGVLEIASDDVVVRGLRIRSSLGDGIQIAPKRGGDIAGIVVDHCSVTNSMDGGIDVTGYRGARVSDVTLSWNYVAGSGAPCPKGRCGGGALLKYGVTRVSAHANFWDKNLRRNPSLDGELGDGATVGDLRGNVVRAFAESGMQVRNGAYANLVGNFLPPGRSIEIGGAFAFLAENAPDAAGSLVAAIPAVAPLPRVAEAQVLAGAGAVPRDPLDAFYRDRIDTWEDAKAARVVPGVAPGAPIASLAAPGTDLALAEHRRLARTARRNALRTASGALREEQLRTSLAHCRAGGCSRALLASLRRQILATGGRRD